MSRKRVLVSGAAEDDSEREFASEIRQHVTTNGRTMC